MTTALLIAALMFGTGIAMYAIVNIFLVLTAPDDDMLTEVTQEAETIDVWGRL